MAHTITISTTKALHSDFKKAVYAAESNVSEVINAFMQSYIDGTQAEFNKLKDKVDDMVNRLESLEGSPEDKEDWNGE